ncbi:hypothetical protein PRZ48_001875 [Zasmidium cellare]|uniref:C2H2-type domain-containing protein n=1 Tax=Zasmidium cellare TaxID=395010 RepID=A0ABR0F2G2_ZASCE|nr:hypothetical protein PRZ48_001875 [Zasmidium cellare]
MVPGPDPMGAPTSFSARRPNAPNLPSVELPPPPFSSLHQYNKPSYSHLHHGHSQPTATTLTSVGNLLTPPSNSSADGLSPTSSGVASTTSLSSHGAVQPFSPNGSGMWPPSTTSGSTPYGFQSGNTPQSFTQGRGLFSPSLNSIVRGSSSPTASEALPPPPYEMPQYSQSMPMSAPSLPAAPPHQQHHMIGNAMMGGQHTPVSAPVTQASPVSAHEGFRPPPTPTNYYSHQSSTPQQQSFPYSAAPQMQQSPVSAGGPLTKMSPVNQHGHVPPLHQSQPQPQYSQHRPYSYQMPVLSNVNNPSGPIALVGGGMPHGMMPAFNSGHAANLHQLYGHPQQPNPQNDRPFRCDQCPQSFNRNHDLKRHKRIHLAVKPFPCGHCDKSFSRKDALKRHVLVKGCGKAHATTEVKEIDGSMSPEPKSESVETSPIVSATA